MTIAHRQEVLTLDPTTLHVKSRTPTRPDPEQLVTLGTAAWVYSAATHTVAPLGGARPVLYLSNVAPILASSGKMIAIEGTDQVTTVSRNETVRQLPLISGSGSPLAVTSSGNVIVPITSEIIDFHN